MVRVHITSHISVTYGRTIPVIEFISYNSTTAVYLVKLTIFDDYITSIFTKFNETVKFINETRKCAALYC